MSDNYTAPILIFLLGTSIQINSTVRLKRHWRDGQGEGSTSAQALFEGRRSTAAYRLRVDIGELVEKYQEVCRLGNFSCGWLRNAVAWHREIMVYNCPLVILWGPVGSFQ